MHKRFVAFAICCLMNVAPVAAENIELSSRTFWLGEQPDTLESYPPFFAPRRIDWIDDIIGNDPILNGTVPHVELALRPASETVPEARPNYVPVTEDRLDLRYDLPGYQIFSYPIRAENPTRPPIRLFYLPDDPNAGFSVSCSVDLKYDTMSLCVIYATYPPDDGIRLKVRLYHPDDPAERPDYFHDVVERLRDLVYCLDVTEESVNVMDSYPTLSGCSPDKVS